MKNNNKIIIGIAVVVALAVAGYFYFGPGEKAQYQDPTTPPSAAPALTQEYNNKTFTVHQGDRFLVTLGDMQWTLSFAPDNIVSRVKNIAAINGSQGVYTADTVGTTTLTAEGRPNCKAGEACPQFIVLFKSTILVE